MDCVSVNRVAADVTWNVTLNGSLIFGFGFEIWKSCAFLNTNVDVDEILSGTANDYRLE
jgi:hypothetical protein